MANLDPRLIEWNYGEYEGKTTSEIRKQWPDWELFRDGCPGGESATDVARRADAVIADLRALAGDVLLFSHGHFLRVLAARWVGLRPEMGRHLLLDTAALSIVGYYDGKNVPVLRLWNDGSYATDA